MAEGELLLREQRHRSANGFAVALAALTMARSGRATGEQIEAAIGRVSAIAALDASLSPPAGTGPVSLAGALGGLAAGLEAAWPGLVVAVEAPDLAVSAADAHRLSLLVAELVANAARHGYGGRGGLVRVSVGRGGDGLAVEVADDGALAGWTRAGGQGCAIVDGLAGLMAGTVERGRGALGGARVVVGLPAVAVAADGAS